MLRKLFLGKNSLKLRSLYGLSKCSPPMSAAPNIFGLSSHTSPAKSSESESRKGISQSVLSSKKRLKKCEYSRLEPFSFQLTMMFHYSVAFSNMETYRIILLPIDFSRTSDMCWTITAVSYLQYWRILPDNPQFEKIFHCLTKLFYVCPFQTKLNPKHPGSED